MTEEKKLDMGFFDETDGLELNFDENYDEVEDNQNEGQENDQNDNDDDSEENSDENNLNENQDEDSEDVVEDNDQEEDNDSSDEAEDNDDDSPNDIYSSFASVLSEQGLLPSLDLNNKEIKSFDDIADVIKSEITNQTKEYLINKVGEKGYEALEKGISLLEYQQHQDTVTQLDKIDESVLENNIELAKKIIQQDYLSQGMDEKRVIKLLKKSIDLGEESILEDAKDSLESLKSIQAKKLEKVAEERQNQLKQQQALQEKIDNDLKNNIYNKEEYIKGIKVNKNLKDKVYKSITQIVGNSPEGVAENKLMRQRRENPIEFDTKLYYIYEITNGFTDFSGLLNKTESKALSKLEQQLRQNRFDGSSRPAYLDDPDSYGGIGSELNL